MLTVETTKITIPTYHRGPDDPYPALTFGGHVTRRRAKPYPYHMQDDIDIATMSFCPDQEHRAVRMSNGLLEAIVLPDLNGRLYSLRDVRTDREIFYRNRVVKPALVGLRGAWLSGGIEFNFPTVGHSVSTVWPVFHRVEQSRDEVAVTVGDLDRSTRELWQVRMSLRAHRAALDVAVTLANPNDYRERLYFWQNAAVPATDDLRFVCRSDWTVGAQATPFPMQNGADRSWHVNNPRPCDHFAYRSHADFFGAFYRDTRMGTYYVGPRHNTPGQKYFTWGTEADNRIWEEYLTDSDGQYVEIQSGVLETQWVTDWLQPHASLRTRGCWFGASDAGEITWANNRAAVAVVERDEEVCLDVVPIDLVGPHGVRLLSDSGESTHHINCQPGCATHIDAGRRRPFGLELRAPDGRLLLQGRWDGGRGLPDDRPRSAPKQWCMTARETPPRRAAENAERYRNWVRMHEVLSNPEQVPEGPDKSLLDAYLCLKTGRSEAALRHTLDGLDVEPGNAELHLVAAASSLRELRVHGKTDAAYAVRDHGLAARLDARFRPAALCMYAESAMIQGRLIEARTALEALLEESHVKPPEAVALLAGVCRHCGDAAGARQTLEQSRDSLATHTVGERWFLDPGQSLPLELPGGGTSDRELQVHQTELVLESLMLYWRVRWFEDLEQLLQAAVMTWPWVEGHPMFHLLLTDIAAERGETLAAREHASRAANLSIAFVAPSRWEDGVLVGRGIALLDGATGSLQYLHGLYSVENDRVEEAVGPLRQIVEPDELRRLAAKVLADRAVHVLGDTCRAIEHLQHAMDSGPPDKRLALELDELLHGQHDVARRQEVLAQLPVELHRRGDVSYRRARLALDCGRPSEALDLLCNTQFSVYEGSAHVRRVYVDALLVDALDHIAARKYDAAVDRCQAVFDYPENLGAASYLGEHSRLARFLLGLIASRDGRVGEAERWWRSALVLADGAATYAIDGVDKQREWRLDERVAVALAGIRLGKPVTDEASAEAGGEPSPEELSGYVGSVIIGGAPEAKGRADEAVRKYPCASLLRILRGLAAVEPLR